MSTESMHGWSEGALALLKAAREAETYEEMEPKRLFAIARGETERDTIHALQNELALANDEIRELEGQIEELETCDQCADYEDEIGRLEDEIASLEAQLRAPEAPSAEVA